ncbi:hypothetical protein HGA92_00140 [Candidatus Gracilibacteria bacterium]|nr:hypothetical protein [Candidatus Gracilibacteria bacterium]NUJ98979.1 hypothetical protein [Candidatus Gracilibacteria bacterium]
MPYRNGVDNITFSLPVIGEKETLDNYFGRVFEDIKSKVNQIIILQKEIHHKTNYPINFDDNTKEKIFDKIGKGWLSNFGKFNGPINGSFASKLNMILGDENFVSIFILCLLTGIIEISDNPINEFSTEFEAKFNEQDIQESYKILKKEKIGFTRFQGLIYDLYYSNGDKKDKRIIRVRRKESLSGVRQEILTLKQRIKNIDEKEGKILLGQLNKNGDFSISNLKKILEFMRICFEEEFLIKKPVIIDDILSILKLSIERAKIKLRTSMVLMENGKIFGNIDLDNYHATNVPTLFETELSNPFDIYRLLSIFGIDLTDKRISTHGSQKTFKQYGSGYLNAEAPYFKEYILKSQQLGIQMMQNGYFDRFQ